VTSLARYTTLGLGGPARRFVTAATDDDLIAAVRAADDDGEPVLILGGGSNLVVADEGFPGTVIHVNTLGVRYGPQSGDLVDVTVAAGEEWDSVVAATVAEGLAGLECLSGIPGRVGATPIQNVGAYGQEVAETITTVRVLDRRGRKIIDIPNEGCGFAYRTSSFKQGSGRFVVLDVTFRLARQALSCPVQYPELAAELRVAVGGQVTVTEARTAVLKVRARKGMVIDPGDPDTRSAGSFFTNPVLDAERFTAVEAVAKERGLLPVPRFEAGGGLVKLPAAWLIERAGFRRGHTGGGARVSSKHTLALVNPGDATTAELVALAREIRDGVREAFGVELEAEPTLVGIAL
jgi:UDP-N-acetylmuramate dehydrogenase